MDIFITQVTGLLLHVVDQFTYQAVGQNTARALFGLLAIGENNITFIKEEPRRFIKQRGSFYACSINHFIKTNSYPI